MGYTDRLTEAGIAPSVDQPRRFLRRRPSDWLGAFIADSSTYACAGSNRNATFDSVTDLLSSKLIDEAVFQACGVRLQEVAYAVITLRDGERWKGPTSPRFE